jgi:tRNA acetyltransferase TAN1
MDANLLVTYSPSHPGKAEKEVGALLEDFGDFEIIDSKMPGLFLVRANDPKIAVGKMRRYSRNRFETTFKWIPIDEWIRTDTAAMEKIIREYDNKINDNESWKLVVVKRHYSEKSTQELVEALARNINREKVDLKDPDRIIVVEIIGERTGLSLLYREEYLDTQKIRN